MKRSATPGFVEILLEHWKSEGASFLDGVTHRALQRAEARIGGRLPDQFQALYSATDGCGVPGTSGADAFGLSFLRLDDCHRDSGSHFLIFADFLTGMWYYAIDLGEETPRRKA